MTGCSCRPKPLAAYARELNPQVYVVPNVASKEMVKLADDAFAARVEARRESRQITIAYLSGSPTHDRDFLQAADCGALGARERYWLAVCSSSGTSRSIPVSSAIEDRITTMPIQPWQRLPRVLADVDINLAPLEPDNAFTESKSCLKYIEAGLVGVANNRQPATRLCSRDRTWPEWLTR